MSTPPASGQPVPRPPSSVKHCAACNTAVVKPPTHCLHCDWWKCVDRDCTAPMNNAAGTRSIAWIK